jgi:hypothetical protein
MACPKLVCSLPVRPSATFLCEISFSSFYCCSSDWPTGSPLPPPLCLMPFTVANIWFIGRQTRCGAPWIKDNKPRILNHACTVRKCWPDQSGLYCTTLTFLSRYLCHRRPRLPPKGTIQFFLTFTCRRQTNQSYRCRARNLYPIQRFGPSGNPLPATIRHFSFFFSDKEKERAVNSPLTHDFSSQAFKHS